jgi:zinc transport system substrate-binding protein
VAPPGEWRTLAALRDVHPADWMLWESGPVSGNVQRLAELGLESTVFDPCANRPASGDFLSIMKKNLENLDRAFGH